MTTSRIRWGAAITGVIGAEVALIAAAVAWVAIYSYLIDPGRPLAVYQQHANVAGPWVSIAVGMPLFYALARWWARGVATARAMLGIYLLLDVALLVMLATGSIPIVLVAVSYLSKLAAALVGAAHARATPFGPA